MHHTIIINGERLPVLVRKHKASRRFVIRYQPIAHALSLTLPRYASLRQGLRFVEEKRSWIEQQIEERHAPIPLVDGQSVPVLGRVVTIERRPGRGVTQIEGERLLVHGEDAFTARRVREFLKHAAKEEIVKLAKEKTQMIGVRPGKISLRDTSSRWGSCSHQGNLSFSWRLVFAPYAVLDYLVCHEVAHIKEHNHSDRFWAVVEELCPGWRTQERWIKTHGAGLYRYR